MNRLEVNFAGLSLANPIILGSGPSTDTFDDIRRAEDAGAGAVITKSIGGHASTPFQPTDQRRYSWHKGLGVHLKSTYLKEILSLDTGTDLVRRSKESCRFPVIASIFHPSLQNDADCEKWKTLVSMHEQAGADAVQLDFFYIDFRKLSDDRIAYVCAAVKEIIASASIPVLPKLNAGMDDDLIRALCQIEQAPGFIMIDSIRCEPVIDVDRGGEPLYDGLLHREGRSVSVIAGEPLLPFTLSYTQRAARLTTRPLCCGGGLSSAMNVVHCMMIGATCVHITSHFMRRGLSQIRKFCSRLEQQLDVLGCDEIQSLIGRSLRSSPVVSERFVKPMPNLQQRVRLIEEKCIHCSICEQIHVCDSFLTTPYQFEDNCDGCTMCVNLCPTNALVLEPLASAMPPGSGGPN